MCPSSGCGGSKFFGRGIQGHRMNHINYHEQHYEVHTPECMGVLEVIANQKHAADGEKDSAVKTIDNCVAQWHQPCQRCVGDDTYRSQVGGGGVAEAVNGQER